MWILEARKWGGSVTGPAGWQGGRDDDKHREGRKTGKEEGRGGEGRGGEEKRERIGNGSCSLEHLANFAARH